jgi:hypothetical protein
VTTSPLDAPSRAAFWVAIAYAAVVVAGLGHFLLGLPVQLSDSFGNMLKLEATWRELMIAEFTQRGYLRPLLWAELKAVYDVSGGDYSAWFRGVHVAQVAGLVALYVCLVRPRTWRDAAVLPIGLAVLIGLHTFAGTVREAFPVNTFLTILLFCFAAAALSLARYRWWNDVLALLLFVVAALTVESGLLLVVIVVGAALLGARGVSRVGVGLVLAACAGYFALRFAVLDIGSPGLIERASGYGFGRYEPRELLELFGDNPLPFYAYNVATSFLSVLFSEPRAGVWRLVLGLTTEPEVSMIVNAIASTLATALIVRYGWHRRRAWMARAFDRDDRLVLLFIMVLAANAVVSYPYTKDVIMSPAGAFYALAAFVALRHWTASFPSSWSPARGTVTVVCCLVLAATWAIRDVGIHMVLRQGALIERNKWAYADQWFEDQNTDLQDPRARALMRTLQYEAMLSAPAPSSFTIIDSGLFDVQ